MTEKSKKYLLITLVSVFIIFFAVLIVAANINSLKPKTKVLFYNLEQPSISAITKNLESRTTTKGKPELYKFITADGYSNLSTMAKKADIVFAKDSLRLSQINTKQVLSANLLKNSTQSIKSKYIKEETLSALPLFFSTNEVLLNGPKARSLNANIKTWDDLIGFASDSRVNFPIVFAGSDPDIFLGFFGSIMESLYGSQSVNALKESIINQQNASTPDWYNFIQNNMEENKDFAGTVNFISNLQKKGLIKTDIFNLSQKDVNFFMENNLTAVVFTTLEQHRTFSMDALKNYISIPQNANHPFYPSSISPAKRSLACEFVCALPMTKKGIQLIPDFVTDKTQGSLCVSTGLAPVNASCQVPDLQSDDGRFWIAATDTPSDSLSLAAFKSKESATLFAEYLKAFI